MITSLHTAILMAGGQHVPFGTVGRAYGLHEDDAHRIRRVKGVSFTIRTARLVGDGHYIAAGQWAGDQWIEQEIPLEWRDLLQRGDISPHGSEMAWASALALDSPGGTIYQELGPEWTGFLADRNDPNSPKYLREWGEENGTPVPRPTTAARLLEAWVHHPRPWCRVGGRTIAIPATEWRTPLQEITDEVTPSTGATPPAVMGNPILPSFWVGTSEREWRELRGTPEGASRVGFTRSVEDPDRILYVRKVDLPVEPLMRHEIGEEPFPLADLGRKLRVELVRAQRLLTWHRPWVYVGWAWTGVPERGAPAPLPVAPPWRLHHFHPSDQDDPEMVVRDHWSSLRRRQVKEVRPAHLP